MPKLSVIIPVYNVGPYLAECLDSVSAQSFEDFEALVVNDASTDNSLEIAKKAAARDNRIRLINHASNQGTHLSRRTGVQQASGTYTFFLDGDDALKPTMMEELASSIDREPADILHFGITVKSANKLTEDEKNRFELFNNAPTPASQGISIVQDIFDERHGQRVDWRFTQRLYRTSLLKTAFARMTKDRLGRSQDGYECFVVSALAASYRPIKECRGYIYYYGRGISGTNMITAETFRRYCTEFQMNFNSARDFALSEKSSILNSCAEGFEHKATEILANDWLVRIPETQKRRAAQGMCDVFGPAVTAREIYRFVRDRAYTFLSENKKAAADDPMRMWKTIADSLFVNTATENQIRRYKFMRAKAVSHLDELDNQARMAAFNEQRIRIFISTHKRVDVPPASMLQPVQVGPGLRTDRMSDTFHDDEGENISDKNPRYCELTTQYWAWKNQDADYYGFCHYRRYFDFSAQYHTENPYGEIMDDYIDDEAVQKYGLDNDSIRNCINGYDIITTRFQDLKTTIDNHGNPIDLYKAATDLHIEDLRTVYKLICEMHPDYAEDARTFFKGNHSCFCNMFIMRKQLFFEYSEWLFPILREFDRRTNMSTYSQEGLRTPGHLAERLLNIWLIHKKRVSQGLHFKELQCVHFEHPERKEACKPLELSGMKKIIPVVFASDDNYVPMLTTTLYSTMLNSSKDYYYDCIVLERDISWAHQMRMRQFLSSFPNMTIRFVNVDREIAGYQLTTSNAHISIETYYRFIIQKILPFYDKVLYLDSDLIVCGDIAELYQTAIGDNLLGAVHDIDYQGNLNNKDGKRLRYSRTVLGMRHPYDYFQAGVLVLNTAGMRKFHSLSEWLKLVSNPTYIYNDQDVLNAECQGRIVYLDWAWNVMHDCDNRVSRIFSHAPADNYAAYLESRKSPNIIHYAGFVKPWTDASCDLADIYWSYARDTPFYEELLQATRRLDKVSSARVIHERAVSENNVLRNLIDPIAPIGSARRETLKSVTRLIRGLK